jgi:hypothetical protein
MCKFIYKQTDDGIYHLYFDDPSKEGFNKIGQAKNLNFPCTNNYKFALLFNEDDLTKTLFGIVDHKIFQVTIPKNSKVSVINGVCIYEKGTLWHTMQLNENCFEEILLGEKHEIFLSCPNNIKFNTLYWLFFTKNTDKYKELYSIVKKKCVYLGKYLQIEYDSCGKIFALKQDGFYDVFTPISSKPEEGYVNEVFGSFALDRIFIWDHIHKGWVAHPGTLFGRNAVYDVKRNDGKNKISLYQMENGSLKLVIENYDYKFVTPSSVVIDGLRFSVDPKTRLIDFDGPMEILKKRIKKTLK